MNIRLPALQHEALSFARKLEIVNSGFWGQAEPREGCRGCERVRKLAAGRRLVKLRSGIIVRVFLSLGQIRDNFASA